MSSRSRLDCIESGFTKHLSETFGVLPPRSKTQHAEEMTNAMVRRRPEIDSDEPPGRSEDAAGFCESSTFQFVR